MAGHSVNTFMVVCCSELSYSVINCVSFILISNISHSKLQQNKIFAVIVISCLVSGANFRAAGTYTVRNILLY